MAKYLDYSGLQYLWGKIENAIDKNSVALYEYLTIYCSNDLNESINTYITITINGQSNRFACNGKTDIIKIPLNQTYTITFDDVDGAIKPEPLTHTSVGGYSREVKAIYKASSVKINILSNQGTDAAIANVKAAIKYGSTSVQVANGQVINIPVGSVVTISFPEVEGYKKPTDITYTHTGGLVEKSGTYQCELLTVNVSADSGSVSGFEVIIAKRETVGVATKYTRLEYIESTGTQYIDTDFCPDQNSVIEVNVSEWPSTNKGSSLFGTLASSGDRYDMIINTSGVYRSYYGGAVVSFDITPSAASLLISAERPLRST